MYFAWKSDVDNERDYTRASIGNVKSLASVKFAVESLIGQLPEIELEIAAEYDPADYFSAGPLFIVSSQLRAVLESVNAVVEFHSVTLRKDGRVIRRGEYFLANLLE